MKSLVFLFASNVPGLLQGCTPAGVGAVHPLWERSISHWGAWQEGGEVQLFASAGDAVRVLGWTAAWSGPGDIYVCSACTSALDVAWRLMESGFLAEGDAVIAVTQWTGRGQVRRPWQSLPGNLHVVWRLPVLPSAWEGLTSLIPAWLTARTLVRLGWDVALKWPNDLICQGRKIGGLLVEQRGFAAMAGLGLNLAATPEPGLLRDGAVFPAGSMDGRICPATCWEHLVSDRDSWYRNILPGIQPVQFAAAFSEMLLWRGRSVIVTGHAADHGGLSGIVLGTAEDGSLMLSANGLVRRVTSGEVRLVL